MMSPIELYRDVPSDRLLDLSPLDEEKFWSRVEFAESCWIWKSTISHFGYGVFYPCRKTPKVTEKSIFAHRVAFWMVRGVEPLEWLELDHLCRVRHCVNPDHLEPVTRSVNVMRGLVPSMKRAHFKAMTHCKHGHEFDALNTQIYVDSHGYTSRKCLACKRREWTKANAKAAIKRREAKCQTN